MTTIEWTDETWNPTTGCDRVSPGCDNCYAATMAKRLKGMGSAKYQNDGDPRTSGPGFALTMHPDTLDAPLGWKKPRKVFVNSMSDLFHADVTDEFIAHVFAVMALTPQHTYQVLTKRPQRMAAWFADSFLGEGQHQWVSDAVTHLTRKWGWDRPVIWDSRVASETNHFTSRGDLRKDPSYDRRVPLSWPLPNVWLGTSIESDRYTFRADHLRATPAVVRFISAEPLLGPLPSLDLTGIDWLIVGGESGIGCRPIVADWVTDLRDRSTIACHHQTDELICSGCGVKRPAFFFKQWGGRLPKTNGRELEGRTWDEYPETIP